MRPLVRGDAPTDENGQLIEFSSYDRAKWYLVERFGPFCAYCERRMGTHINVEHLQARAIGGVVIAWLNFLLSCQSCNSTKGARSIAGLYFPHEKNTSYAFVYAEGAVISPNPELTAAEQDIARQTLALFGLDDLKPSAPNDPDRRFDDYVERWNTAQVSLERLQRCDTPELREQIADTAHENGAFSIYLSVFRDDRDMCLRIIERFNYPRRSLRRVCFDSDGQILPNLHL